VLPLATTDMALTGRRQPAGDNALVAFPASGANVHLDVDGKLNGGALPRVQLITGHNHQLYIWGSDDTQTPHSIGLATQDLGKTWETLSPAAAGVAVSPVAASPDGAAVLALTADQSQAALSRDGGRTWSLQQGPGVGASRLGRASFVTGTGQLLLRVGGGAPAGMYTQRNGTWVKVTTRDVIATSRDANGNLARLWSYDADRLVTWTTY
jgi:hypothetical protein